MQTIAPATNNEPPAAAQQSHDPGAAGFVYALPAYGFNPPPARVWPPTAPIYQPAVPARVWPTPIKEVPPIRRGPISTLPEDIILHICKLGVDSLNSQKRVDFVVMVSHVCRTWRNVATSCSSLWAEITIAPRNVHPNVAPALAHGSLLRAQEFTLRSRLFPLSVRLELPMAFPGTVVHTSVIMDWLCQVLPRVKYLSVSCDTIQAARAIMSRLQPARMEALEDYEMKYGDAALSLLPAISPPPGPHPYFLFLTGQNCPKLTHVKVSGLPVHWSQWSLTGLTSLSINFMTLHDRPSMNTLKHILTMNRETLEKFEIQGAIQPFGLPMGELPTTLPRLTHLTIGYLSQWEPCYFMIELHVPALKHLKLLNKSRSILGQHWPQSFQHRFNLYDPTLHNRIGLQSFNYFSSTILLKNVVGGWTPLLEQLETLELEHFNVPPMFNDNFRQRNAAFSYSDLRVALAHRMLQSCLRLRCLILTDSDECFLDALNHYPKGTDADDTNKRIPAPALTHLYIFTHYPEHLRLFLKKRAKILDIGRKGPHIWDQLELATRPEYLGGLVKAIGLDHNDLNRVAKSTVVSGWEEGFNIDI